MSTPDSPPTARRILRRLRTVDDPEYPGVSIVDLGIVADVRVDEDCVTVELVPTFSGCPAFAAIESDVAAAVTPVAGGRRVRTVRSHLVWSTDRISAAGRRALARDFTVAVARDHDPPRCPRCGGDPVEISPFGPTRCRAVHRCPDCGEHVEVMRS